MKRAAGKRVALTCWWAMAATHGWAASSDPIDAALRDVRPAGSACKNESAAADPATPASPELAPPDLSCALSVPALAQLRANADTLIVDTRLPDEFAEFHIDSAINMSWGELRARKYLHARPIVLAGSGKGESTLYSACAELQAVGVNRVHVLRGGMAAWAKAQQPVVGRSPDVLAQAMLTDEELLDELAFGANVVLALPGAEALQKLIPRAVPMDGSDHRAVVRMMKQRQIEVGTLPFASIVIVSDRAARPTDLAKLLSAAVEAPVLIYASSAQHYSAFTKSKRAMWLASARGPVQPRCPAM